MPQAGRFASAQNGRRTNPALTRRLVRLEGDKRMHFVVMGKDGLQMAILIGGIRGHLWEIWHSKDSLEDLALLPHVQFTELNPEV